MRTKGNYNSSELYFVLNTGHKIPAVGLGTWQADGDICTEAVRTALDVGYRHLDCAHLYGNEVEVGQALAEALNGRVPGLKREDVFVTSKLWCTTNAPKRVETSVRVCLKNLGLSYLDLYLVHWPVTFSFGDATDPPRKAGMELRQPSRLKATWQAMECLVEKGLVNSIGVSNFSIQQIEELLSFAKIIPAVNQEARRGNNFQKDLSYLNPLVRAWALRAMSGIRVHVVAQLVLMAVNKCARDPSPYVRRCVANAIPKLYDLDREQNNPALEEVIELLFNDNSAGVVGVAAAAFNVVCPNNLLLVGPKFKRLCETLPDVDEWGRIFLIEILLRYTVAKHGISKTSAAFDSGYAKRLFVEREHSDDYLESLKPNMCKNMKKNGVLSGSITNKQNNLSGMASLNSDPYESDTDTVTTELHSDVKLLLQCTSPLFWSQNSGVVLAAAGVHWLMAPVKEVKRIVKPLLFLLRSSYDSQYVVLANLATFVGEMPSLFEPYFEDFFIRSSDTYHMRAIKLEILSGIATESSIHTILEELQDYVRDPDRKFAADAVAAIGRCAKRLPTVALTCLKGLLALVRQSSISLQGSNNHGNEKTVESRKVKFPRVKAGRFFRADWMLTNDADREECVLTQEILAIKTILQQHPDELEKVFVQLIRSLDLIKVASARAVVIWMVGEYSSTGTLIPKIVPTILQYLAACFPKEGLESKLQILNCASKILLHREAADRSITSLVVNYLLDMGECDLSYDVRDRARMLKKLLTSFCSICIDERNDASHICTGKHHFSSADLPQPRGAKPEKTQDNSKYSILGNTTFQWHGHHSNVVPEIAKYVLSCNMAPVLHSERTDRLFFPGSLSHIVQHTAPGYKPLPKPCSLHQTNIPGAAEVTQPSEIRGKSTDDDHDSSGEVTDDIYSSSGESFSEGSLHEELSGSGQELDQSVTSEGSDKMEPKNRLRSSLTRVTMKPLVKSGSSDNGLKINKSNELEKRHAIEPLISLSDDEHQKENVVDGSFGPSGSVCQQLMREDAFESWLGPKIPESGTVLSTEESIPSGYASLSIGAVDAELRKHTLLDFTNGDGMSVMYAFSTQRSSYSPAMVCVRLFFENRSSEAFLNIVVRAHESKESPSEWVPPPTGVHDQATVSSDLPAVIPMQEIPCLDAGESTEADLNVFFRQHTPLKLRILCNRKCYSVTLMPEIWALMRPLSMSLVAFRSKESQISGMLEYCRRCTFKEHHQSLSKEKDSQLQHDDNLVVVARDIASVVLRGAHVSIVSVTIPVSTSFMDEANMNEDIKGLCLRFSGETLLECTPCLITVTVEGCYSSSQLPVLVKINCEDTVFGLNLLKRLVEVLSED